MPRLPSERQIRRLEDILDNIARIERFTADLDFAAFAEGEQVIFAVFHALLIISEAARRLQSDAEQLMPDQPWPAIRAIGNVLRHQYDDVDALRIWQLVHADLPSLRLSVERALIELRKA
jgi:uncharacterized protein with HEPN domain